MTTDEYRQEFGPNQFEGLVPVTSPYSGNSSHFGEGLFVAYQVPLVFRHASNKGNFTPPARHFPSPYQVSQRFRPNEFRESFLLPVIGFSSKFQERIEEIYALKRGWDGDKAVAPKSDVVERTIAFMLYLRAKEQDDFIEPFFVPTVNGFTQLEWRKEGRYLEFESTVEGWAVVANGKNKRGEIIYHEAEVAKTDWRTLSDAYRWFVGTELLWPLL